MIRKGCREVLLAEQWRCERGKRSDGQHSDCNLGHSYSLPAEGLLTPRTVENACADGQ